MKFMFLLYVTIFIQTILKRLLYMDFLILIKLWLYWIL